MTTFLLDVNVLLALSDPQHIHFDLAHRWFFENGKSWATCPIAENGFVRIASRPSYPNPPGDVLVVLALLRGLVNRPGHDFWPDEVTVLDVFEPDVVITSSQITDVYLLGLAAYRGGKLATLDRRIPVHAVRGGAEAIEFVID